jgi:ribonuclease Z
MDGLTRKDFLKASGLAAGGFLAGGALGMGPGIPAAAAPAPLIPAEADRLRSKMQNNWYYPVEDLDKDEIRVTFMGTNFGGRPGQAMSSVFIETGNGDSFVFDCGTGCISKYTAMGVPSSRMTKVFLAHLHADHTSDLTTLYAFGPAHDRKTPLHVYGPSGPILRDRLGREHEYKEQGTKAYCDALCAMCAWHREAMSFMNTGLKNGQDGYQLESHELRYRETRTTA